MKRTKKETVELKVNSIPIEKLENRIENNSFDINSSMYSVIYVHAISDLIKEHKK